jgi:dipeptidase E
VWLLGSRTAGAAIEPVPHWSPRKEVTMPRILLVSNSGRPFLEHCRADIAAFLGTQRRLAFVSAASYDDETAYHDSARRALEPVDLDVSHLRTEDAPLDTLARAEALFVGGGNTYHLLRRLHAARLLEPIRERVRAGMPYVGSSAGSNVAGPNILTTNDWNVDGLTRFEALGLVPFNINPHYLETDPVMAPYSETRDERIEQYLHVHDNPVVGIEEGTLVRWEEERGTVLGRGRVKLFRRDRRPAVFRTGASFAL